MTDFTSSDNCASRDPLAGERILLVNDSVFQLESLRLFLTRNGFVVEVSSDGGSALEMVRRNSPNLVISDVVMPGIDGVELCRRLKGDPTTCGIPVLLLTGLRYNNAGVVEGLEAGADDYLELDAPPSLLLKKAERLIGQERERRARLQAEADRNRALERLKEAVELKEAIFQGSRDAIFISNEDSFFIIVNRAACDLTGYTADELLAMRIPDLHEETDLEAFRKYHDRVIAGEELVSEAPILRKDRTKVVTEFNNRRIVISGKPCMHSVARDITERKQAEEQLKQFAAKLEKSNDELEGFAYIASHDLQEPLRKIQAFGDRLRSKCGYTLNSEAIDYLDRMEAAARRMQTLITDLLKLSRVTTRARPFVRVDLAQIVKEVVSDLELQIEQTGGTVKTGYLPSIEADPTQLRQLFQNLIGNALKFHRPGDPPVVEIEDDLLSEHETRSNGHRQPSEFCRIVVQDNGIGFDPKHIHRIFAPFQRLHGRGEYDGTGIGLTVCQKIAERHKGTIAVESSPGDGARFVISLPMRQNPASPF